MPKRRACRDTPAKGIRTGFARNTTSSVRPRRVRGSAAEAEALDDLVVFGEVVLLEILKQLAAAAGHEDQATAGVEVLAVGAKVLGEVSDAGGQQGDLDFGGTGVLVARAILADDLGLVDGFRHGVF